MENFTPIPALIGGGLIGLSAAVLFLGLGRIAGISGLLGGILTGDASERNFRLAFISGLIVGAMTLYYGLGMPAEVTPQASLPWLIGAGLLVGFGTRMGSGCTSGHGVCGLARLSPRSLVATCTFFGVALVTVFVLRHVIGG